MYLVLFVVTIFILILFSKVLRTLILQWDRSPTCLIGKTVIVTGANTGIGFYTAQDFAKRGARVILACRNEEKAQAARSKIIKATGNWNIVVQIVDMESFESVREFASKINETEKCLHILVNNAGILCPNNSVSGDGMNKTKKTNYLGPFLLTVLLVDLMVRSAPSRIINLTSILSHLTTVNSDTINSHCGNFKDYAQSKLLIMLFTNELANRLKGTGVVVHSVNPGEVNTEITKHFPSYIEIPGIYFKRAFFKTLEEGAQTTIYAAVSKQLGTVTGKYLANCSESRWPSMPTLAKDTSLCHKIFEETVLLVGLRLQQACQTLHNKE